jgi:hypothetical protein
MEAYGYAGDFCWLAWTLFLGRFVGLMLFFSGIIWGGVACVG